MGKYDEEFEDTGIFLKVESGTPVFGFFVGDIKKTWVKWTDGKPEEVERGSEGAKFRFRQNFIVHEKGDLENGIHTIGITRRKY